MKRSMTTTGAALALCLAILLFSGAAQAGIDCIYFVQPNGGQSFISGNTMTIQMRVIGDTYYDVTNPAFDLLYLYTPKSNPDFTSCEGEVIKTAIHVNPNSVYQLSDGRYCGDLFWYYEIPLRNYPGAQDSYGMVVADMVFGGSWPVIESAIFSVYMKGMVWYKIEMPANFPQ